MPALLTAFSQNFENLKLNGAPVDWVALDPVVAYLHPLSLSAKAPHPVAGRLFIDFLLSAKGQEIMRSLQRIPDRNDTLPGTRRLVEGSSRCFRRRMCWRIWNAISNFSILFLNRVSRRGAPIDYESPPRDNLIDSAQYVT